MDYDIQNEFQKAIDSQVAAFLQLIQRFCEEGFSYDRVTSRDHFSGFPLLGMDDSAFYINQSQMDYFEGMVRDILVNELLNYLFVKHKYDIRWRWKDSRMTTFGRSNIVNEEKLPVEFFIIQDNCVLAYRYTYWQADYSIKYNLPRDFDIDYMDTGIKHENITNWVFIDWSGKSKQEVIDYYQRGRVHEDSDFGIITTVYELFLKYFSETEYDQFVSGIRNAVIKAKDYLGFQTIHKLVPRNYLLFKNEILASITPDVINTLQYKMTNEQNHIIPDAQRDVSEEDKQGLSTLFWEKTRYLSLTGSSLFANSFITSEYLYRIFKSGIPFDYTAIVTGYIKSIEQLLCLLIYDIFVPINNCNLLMLAKQINRDEMPQFQMVKNKKMIDKRWYVPMTKDNQQYYCPKKKMTLGNMVYFFEVNADGILSLSSESLSFIIPCMNDFVEYNRNGFFHKDNINDFSVVERIRNNTLLLLYWILGALKTDLDSNDERHQLGIIDSSFDSVFQKIARKRAVRYSIAFSDGIERKVLRLPPNTAFIYDQNGLFVNSVLEFVEVESYPQNYLEFKEFAQNHLNSAKKFVIDRNHLPTSLYLIGNNGEKVEKIL